MPRARMHTNPSRAENVQLADWKADGNDYVAVGRVTPLPDGQLAVDFDLVNVLNGQRLASQRFTRQRRALRNAAHRVSDVIYEKILGVRGAFATRIAYVAVNGQPPAQVFQLIVADADGENPRMILESRQPMMSPAWSPDGQWLAYVSFENQRSAIYVQEVRTGERRLVSARAGINGAPAWSPDGRKLALTLGGAGGNPDIYVLDLGTQDLTRLTDDPAIDTEAAWAPDGNRCISPPIAPADRRSTRSDMQSGARPKRDNLRGHLQRPAADVGGRQAARHGDAGSGQLPHRRAGSAQRHRARAVARPAGCLAELCAQRRLSFIRTRKASAACCDGVGRRPDGPAPEVRSG